MSKNPDLCEQGITTRDGRTYRKLHLCSLRKLFFSQATAEVSDAVAQTWCGRKAYLSNYLRLEERQKLYLKVMPRLTIYGREPSKTEDRLKDRLGKMGISDQQIDKALEGLILA